MRALFFGLIALQLIGMASQCGVAWGQSGQHGDGHAEHHDQYRLLHNPNTGASCCNGQSASDPNGDCRPGAVWRDADGRLRARIGSRTLLVPEEALIPSEKNPHPPVGMICERGGYFYCVALSGAGG